jgi:hypothetical protein
MIGRQVPHERARQQSGGANEPGASSLGLLNLKLRLSIGAQERTRTLTLSIWWRESQLKESNVSNLSLPRRGFLVGLASLLAAPAVLKPESLTPISVWRPRLEAWRTRAFCQDWLGVGGYNLDDFYTGRFDLSLSPDWVRKSLPFSARAIGVSCSASTTSNPFRWRRQSGLNVAAPRPCELRRRRPDRQTHRANLAAPHRPRRSAQLRHQDSRVAAGHRCSPDDGGRGH